MEWVGQWWIQWGFGIVAAALVGLWRHLTKRLKKTMDAQKAVSNGLQALLRDRIIQAYNHYMDRGECPIYARDNVQALYKEYAALGGNGTVSGLVSELMKLPTEKQHKEEK